MVFQKVDDAEPERQKFLALVGDCITTWAAIEKELFYMCYMILGCREVHTAIVFYRTPTLASRIELTDELINSVYPRVLPGGHPHEHQKLWTDMQKEIKKLLPIRNQLAHSPVGHVMPIEEDEETGASNFLGFSPASMTAETEAYRKRGEQKQLVRQGLDDYVPKIHTLKERLKTFRSLQLKWQLPVFLEQGFDDW